MFSFRTPFIKKVVILGMVVLAAFPFFAGAQNAINIRATEIGTSSALITGKLGNVTNQSVKIGYYEKNNTAAQKVYTPPFALGPNNTISKGIVGLNPETDYCAYVVDASAANPRAFQGSTVCFKTLSLTSTQQVEVQLDSQSAGFQNATLRFKVKNITSPLGLSIHYGSGADGVYDKEGGEFFRQTTAGNFDAKVELKDLTGNTDYNYEIYNSDNKTTQYLSSMFRTSQKDGQVLNTDGGTSAALPPGCIAGQYCLLAPLPGLSTIDTTNTTVGKYLGIIFKIGIALAGVLAVVMLVFGGIEYMTSDVITSKESAKSRMTSAVLGLILVLGAYAILNTLNPNLTIFNIDLKEQTIDIENADTDTPVGGLSQFTTDITSLGITCPGTGGTAAVADIAKSFKGKVTYGYGSKGEAGPGGTVKLDCSGYVNRVLQCANVSFINSGTGGIFANAEKVTNMTDTEVNGVALKAGDLIGWKQGGGERYGHVMIYVGNGEVMDSHGPSGVIRQAIGTFPPTQYKNRITFIKRAP